MYSRGRYWLHIRPNGSEEHYDDAPNWTPCKIVTVYDDCEETFTKDETMPPGKGWRYEGYDDRGFSIWRRPR